ncbi:MAG: hypothetical protein ABI624_14110 [Casimicrobiaceae bacterium]
MEYWSGTEDLDEAQEELFKAGVTDGLPVVPPTQARVTRMLQRNAADGDEVVAIMPPSYEEATWREIAINAVMAGCLPEYLPVVGAAVAAMSAPEFNLVGIATTTGSAAPLVIVNGPAVARVGLNGAGNALGPGSRANACIGRAVSLVLRNVGGAQPGVFDMATLGQPAKYTCCFAENAAESPWPPLHVERGFALDESVVTVVGIAGTVEIVDSVSHAACDLAQTFAQSMLIAGSRGVGTLLGGGEPLIVVPPEIAQLFQRDGYTKAMVRQAIFDRAELPLDRLSPPVHARLVADLGMDIGAMRIATSAEDVMIVVAGGVGIKSMYAPTWGGGTRAVSRRFRLP